MFMLCKAGSVSRVEISPTDVGSIEFSMIFECSGSISAYWDKRMSSFVSDNDVYFFFSWYTLRSKAIFHNSFNLYFSSFHISIVFKSSIYSRTIIFPSTLMKSWQNTGSVFIVLKSSFIILITKSSGLIAWLICLLGMQE